MFVCVSCLFTQMMWSIELVFEINVHLIIKKTHQVSRLIHTGDPSDPSCPLSPCVPRDPWVPGPPGGPRGPSGP